MEYGNGAREVYIYNSDDLQRLKHINEPTRTIDYEYDASGNRTKQTVIENVIKKQTEYYYNEQNRLNRDIPGQPGKKGVLYKENDIIKSNTEYAYGNNGNQTKVISSEYTGGVWQSPNIIQSSTYDDWNRNTQTISNGYTVVNTYNGEDLRVAKQVDGTLTRYLLEYDNAIFDMDSSGTIIARNIYGTNLAERTVSNVTYNYMYNGHADVTALIDASDGIVAGTYYYDAFGNIVSHAGMDSDMTYTGYKFDKETGL